MNFGLVLMLSLFGVAIGLASAFGFVPPGIETLLWIVVAIVCAVVIAKQTGRPFLHGFLTGLFAGVIATLIQATLFGQYLAHHPKAADSFKALPSNLSPRLLVAVMSPIVGLVDGIVLGCLAWLAGKTLARKRSAPAT